MVLDQYGENIQNQLYNEKVPNIFSKKGSTNLLNNQIQFEKVDTNSSQDSGDFYV